MKTIVIAPHPDDEILGCGGTILKRISEGVEVFWVIVTEPHELPGWTEIEINKRNHQIYEIGAGLGLKNENVIRMGYPAAGMDTIKGSDLISNFYEIFADINPNEVFLPHWGDAHSDHNIIFNAANACTKPFRNKEIKTVMTYETMSETHLKMTPESNFNPNFHINISPFIEKKLNLLSIYESEIEDHPFPRSLRSVRAQSEFRGANSGFECAEAFFMLKHREL